jgi:hypothetical protein
MQPKPKDETSRPPFPNFRAFTESPFIWAKPNLNQAEIYNNAQSNVMFAQYY